MCALVGNSIEEGTKIKIAVVFILGIFCSPCVIFHQDEKISLTGSASPESVLTIVYEIVSFQVMVNDSIHSLFKHSALSASNSNRPISRRIILFQIGSFVAFLA